MISLDSQQSSEEDDKILIPQNYNSWDNIQQRAITLIFIKINLECQGKEYTSLLERQKSIF